MFRLITDYEPDFKAAVLQTILFAMTSALVLSEVRSERLYFWIVFVGILIVLGCAIKLMSAYRNRRSEGYREVFRVSGVAWLLMSALGMFLLI